MGLAVLVEFGVEVREEGVKGKAAKGLGEWEIASA
jgi:hypothetical protein